MSKKYTLLTFKGICMNFLLKLKFLILGHPVTSKQPHKIVQILLAHCMFIPDYSVHDRPRVQLLPIISRSRATGSCKAIGNGISEW